MPRAVWSNQPEGLALTGGAAIRPVGLGGLVVGGQVGAACEFGGFAHVTGYFGHLVVARPGVTSRYLVGKMGEPPILQGVGGTG